jgi:hypothetical protein
MRRAICIGLGLFFSMSVGLAQGEASYDGRWKILLDGKANPISGQQKVNNEGALVLAGQGGTWQLRERNSKDACSGREMPIKVLKTTHKLLSIKILRSRVMAGCHDIKLVFKKVDQRSLEAKFGDGRRVSVTRE